MPTFPVLLGFNLEEVVDRPSSLLVRVDRRHGSRRQVAEDAIPSAGVGALIFVESVAQFSRGRRLRRPRLLASQALEARPGEVQSRSKQLGDVGSTIRV